MKLSQIEGGWSIGLETKDEARALLAVQATSIGNTVLSTTDVSIDRITPGRAAIERLRFAELVLPADGDTPVGTAGVETVAFPVAESQHLSGLLYGAANEAQQTGRPVTEFDPQLLAMEDQVEAFFGMS